MNMKIVMLDAYTTNPGDLSWESLNKSGELTVYDRTPESKIIERAKDADIVITNKTPITKEIIDCLPKLKFIALMSTGYNIVDYVYLKEKVFPFLISPHTQQMLFLSWLCLLFLSLQ